jgi:hypothetical protein
MRFNPNSNTSINPNRNRNPNLFYTRRQQFLYEEFMSRSGTRSLLSGANYMGMMNILMQLRKVRVRVRVRVKIIA